MFNENIKELEELHNKDQYKVEKELDTFVRTLKDSINNNNNEYLMNQPNYTVNGLLKKLGINKEADKFYLAIMFFLIALLGLINIKGYTFYLFGLAFFAAGVCVGLYAKGYGIIFLFSHGGTGFGLMVYALLIERYSVDALTDLSFNMKVYLGVIIALIIIGFLGTVVNNLSDTLSKNPSNKVVPLILLAIVLFLVGMIPLVSF